MNCDQAFDCLTSPAGRHNSELQRHLGDCPRCRDMSEILEPALDLFQEVCEPVPSESHSVDGPASIRHDRASSDGSSEPSSWMSSAPWQRHVRSAARSRRDGLRVASVIMFVAVLMFAVLKVGSDDSGIGFEATALGDDCIRAEKSFTSSEAAVAACVACHLQLPDSDKRITVDGRSRAGQMIRKCVDCHLDASDDQARIASATGSGHLCLLAHHEG